METTNEDIKREQLLKSVSQLYRLVVVLFFSVLIMPVAYYFLSHYNIIFDKKKESTITVASSTSQLTPSDTEEGYWIAPSMLSVNDLKAIEEIQYGKELIMHTSKYLGPQGSVAQISNGLNCQNCHLDAGTRVYGNNYGSVASTYPKMRARSGTMESIFKRVNDCFERSLNGVALDTNSKEMLAIKAYIEFLGTDVPKGEKVKGSGLKDIAYLERAADPELGKDIYAAKCQSCHQADGQGILAPNGKSYQYPPLWGEHSYNDAAGLYRLSNFAKYVKYNMPLGATHRSPQLSDEEAWDLAAFVNSQPRPHKPTPNDWPDISKKPFDHPFGPYADNFSEKQHKYGPFGEMKK